LLIGVTGPFGFEVIGDGVAGAAAEEDRSAGAAFAPYSVQPS
jgi:hypothetical protein